MNRNTKDTVITALTAVSVILILFVIISILTITVIGGWKNLTWEFLTEFPKDGMTKGGIFPAIVGTALMTLIMTVAAVPFGTITAVYLAEYARENSFIARYHPFCSKDTGGGAVNHFRVFRPWIFYQVCRFQHRQSPV